MLTAGINSICIICIKPLETIKTRSGHMRFIRGSNFGSDSVEEYFVCIVRLHFRHSICQRKSKITLRKSTIASFY